MLCISRTLRYTKTFDFEETVETYKRNKHAGHNLHCTIITGWKFAGAYRKIAKKKKQPTTSQQGGMRRRKL